MLHPLTTFSNRTRSGNGPKNVLTLSVIPRKNWRLLGFSHTDPKLPLNMAAEASACGVGAVLLHTYPDGSKRPFAFDSRYLISSERNYAQIEKEALALE